MSVKICWLGHASFVFEGTAGRVAVDPWKLPEAVSPVSLILISHSHFDHYSAPDVARLREAETVVCGPADIPDADVLEVGQSRLFGNISVTGVPAYSVGKPFHPRSSNWLGFVVELDGISIYYAGDTDRIPEMARVPRVNVGLFPVGGTYTMDAAEAALAAADVSCELAIPYHWGDIVGGAADAEAFAAECRCEVRVLRPGEACEIDH